MSATGPETIGAEIETLVEKLAGLGNTPAAAQAQELVRLLMSLYGSGLARMLAIVRTEEGGPAAVLDRFAADPLLASLLVLHELHPHPAEVRVQRACAELEPHLPEHTRVTLVSIEGDIARVNVARPAGGQGGSSNLRLAIERAVQEAAPEIATVQVDGLGEPLIQIARPARAQVSG